MKPTRSQFEAITRWNGFCLGLYQDHAPARRLVSAKRPERYLAGTTSRVMTGSNFTEVLISCEENYWNGDHVQK